MTNDTTLDRGTFGPFARSLNDTPHGYLKISDPTGDAPTQTVEKFDVRPGDCGKNADWNDCENDRERSELSERGNRNRQGETHWYGWSLYLPKNHQNVFPTKLALGQFHQKDSHVVWMFQQGKNCIYLDEQVTGKTRSKETLIKQDELTGRWHQFEIHVKWTTKNDGFFCVWVNGMKKVEYAGPTMSADIIYFKYGVYRSFLSSYRQKHRVDHVPAQTAMFANVRRAKTRAGLAPQVPS